MAESAEDLRQRAQSFRQAAEQGPRRNRAYCLTVAYCLEQRVAHMELNAQRPGWSLVSERS
jgi:hypothetical protein